jgi:hypothetical protein
MPMPDQKPLQKQDGGFMMSDKNIYGSSAESLYSIMKKHFDTIANKTFFESVLKGDKPPNNDINFLDSNDYKEIYNRLIGIIMTDAEYTQTFEYSDGAPKYESKERMHNYHIQLCALMTMSFLFELELFSVVHNYIPINIGTTKNNLLPSTFAHESTPQLRYYKDLITKGGLDAMLDYFTQSLDTFFDDFMKKLLDEIGRLINYYSYHPIITPEEILDAIVPVKSIKPPHHPGKFDYIYVNWKDRIKQKIKEKPHPPPNPYAAYDDNYYSICINMAIDSALNHVEYGGSTYIAEGTGFFSFLYLLPKPGVKENYNGSCITYSMLELYIMARLHVHANRLTLNMESALDDVPHDYWKSVQNDEDIKLPSVTHWATQYEFQSYPLSFRSIPEYRGKIKTKHLFNFVDPDKPNLCLLLLYPIFDSYMQYISQPEASTKLYQVSIAMILPFIERRIQFVKTLFSHKSEKVVTDERGKPISESTSKVDITSIPSGWFKNVFGFDEDVANFATTQKASFNVKRSASDHILMTVKTKEIDIGVFRYVSVQELLGAASANTNAMSVFGFDLTTNLKYYTMASTSRAIHINPSYHDSIFQVASQFNALEMENPAQTPQDGITIYHADRTQGPACAMMCPFGTLYRNYFCMPSASTNEQPADKSVNGNPQTGIDAAVDGSVNNQINTLTELMKVDSCFNNLTFQNGYIFVNDKPQLDDINKYLSNPVNFWNAMMAIKYVIQEDTPVVNAAGDDGKIMDHKVSQIYCSAYPVAYDHTSGTSPEDFYLLSSMILHAVYYSTLAYAVSRITPDEPRKKVFLTRVGGGVFHNEAYIIDTAIYNAVSHFIAYPIDVYIVGYTKDEKGQAKIIDPEKIDGPLRPTIVTTVLIPAFTSAPYIDIQTMLDKKATDETEKVKKATEEMVTKKKEEETKLRSSLKIKKSVEEELDKAKAKSDKEKAKAKLEEKAKKTLEDKLHEEKSKKKHLKLNRAIDTAIRTFFDTLIHPNDKKYADILGDLMVAINKDRVREKADDAEKSKKLTRKKSKPLFEKNSKDEVMKFIKDTEDAIFVVTGGSFNPPHNGHIGMFQKAYEALKAKFPSKKVYGVMAPATDEWIEGKLCKEAHKKTDKCTDAELAAPLSKAAIELKRIQLANRVNLCKLSCDSYEWTSDPTNFNALNMIVVNESAQGEEFTKNPNTYYLCGSDYYASSGSGPSKFICVLRSGVTATGLNMTFDKAPKEDGVKEYPVKATDIIIENDGEDNEASSTMLRDILTKIRDADDISHADEPITKNLLTKQVYCELLKMGYIVGAKGKDIAVSLKCGDDKAIIPMKLTGKASDPNKDKFIKELADSFENCNSTSSNKSSFSSKEVTDILNRVYDNGHYMLLNDIHFMNKNSHGQPLIFQLMSQKYNDEAQSINSLKFFTENKFEVKDIDIYPSYKAAFDGLSPQLKQEYETLCKFLFETERNAILFQILRVNEAAKEQTSFAGTMRDFYDDLLKKEGDARETTLAAVGYTFKSAYGDGNCFYNSAGMQLIGPVVDYNGYDKLNRNDEWQTTQLQKQARLRTDLTEYLKKLYSRLKSHSNFATSENITIKYLRTNGGKEFVNVSTIKSGIGSQFWGTDDELYFIAALYDCFIVILPSNDTNFQTIEYTEKINSDESDQDKLFNALSDPSIPIFSPDELIAKLGEITRAKKQIIFMLGGKGHWDYAIPTK